MPGELVPILIVLTVCAYLGWRRYLQHQQRITAIQRGMDPQTVPREAGKTSREKGSRASKDHRLGSLVLIAIGLGYGVAVFFSVGVYKGVERAVAAAVWGLLPLAIGAARYTHEAFRTDDETPNRHRRSAFVLMSAGIAYMVCITLSVGILRGAERAVAAGVWGILPLAIGVALFIYSDMVRKEWRDQGQRGAP